MPLPRLYTDLARWWPVLSPPSDYTAEARAVRRVVEQALGPVVGLSIVEFGAGAGHTLSHLADAAGRVAVDLSPDMLALCRALDPCIETIVGDMRSVRLGRRFHAVLLHDAIDYMTTPVDAAAAITTAAAHLRPGGIALIAPTYTRETFAHGEAARDRRTAPDSTRLTLTSRVIRPDPDADTFDLLLTLRIASPDGSVESIEDHHACGLFSELQWCEWIDAAGLTRLPTTDLPGPWRAFIAQRRIT